MDMLHYLKTVLSTTHFLVHLLKREIQNNKSSFVSVWAYMFLYSHLYYSISPSMGKKITPCSVLYSEWSTTYTMALIFIIGIFSTQMHRYVPSSIDNHCLLGTHVFRCFLNKKKLVQILSSTSFLNSSKGNLQNAVAKFYPSTSLFFFKQTFSSHHPLHFFIQSEFSEQPHKSEMLSIKPEHKE